jgi:hypothetical protein
MRKRLWCGLCWALLATACRGNLPTLPTASSPVPAPVPRPTPPPAAFPTITVGEVVRFRFTADDVQCGSGRCRSYNVSPASNGRLEVVLTPVSAGDELEMYVVPGGDSWDVGPGPRISVTISARAGGTYEIRMYAAKVPNVELELRASLQ